MYDWTAELGLIETGDRSEYVEKSH